MRTFAPTSFSARPDFLASHSRAPSWSRHPLGYRLTGDLTIRGVTRSVILQVENGGRVRDPRGYDRAGFSAHTAINRNDFGIWVNMVIDLGGLALSERVDIDIDVEAIRKA